eukprot:Hpha_TRINITY_DN15735_c5_g1::TRINITY_DN15735_c5_g1_i7::g.42003::m.42003
MSYIHTGPGHYVFHELASTGWVEYDDHVVERAVGPHPQSYCTLLAYHKVARGAARGAEFPQFTPDSSPPDAKRRRLETPERRAPSTVAARAEAETPLPPARGSRESRSSRTESTLPGCGPEGGSVAERIGSLFNLSGREGVKEAEGSRTFAASFVDNIE